MTLSPTAPAPATVTLADPADWHRGIEVVLAAQAATGLPPSTYLAPADVADVLAADQAAALGVWLATVPGTDGTDRVVGHGLLAVVDPAHPGWALVTDPIAVAAMATGRLVSLGRLAVHPAFTGRGIAAALADARVAYAHRHGLLPCASVWDSSPGSTRIAHRHGRVVGHHPSAPSTLFVYDR